MENQTTQIATSHRFYVKDDVLKSIIKSHFAANEKTTVIAKGVKALGYSTSPRRVNKVLGRYTKSIKALVSSLSANKAALLNAVKTHAFTHYDEEGWDIAVETFNDQDLLDIIGESWTPQGAIAKVHQYIAPIAAQRAEVQATEF